MEKVRAKKSTKDSVLPFQETTFFNIFLEREEKRQRQEEGGINE